MSLNKVLLIGNVGREPDVRHLESGASVATIGLATSERFKDKNGNTQEITEWHTVICWRSLADVAERFIHKGTQIYVEGRIRSREYTDQSGQKRRVTEIIADNLQLLGKRQDTAPSYQSGQSYQQAPSYQSGSSYNYQPQQPAQQQAPAEELDNSLDGDLPF